MATQSLFFCSKTFLSEGIGRQICSKCIAYLRSTALFCYGHCQTDAVVVILGYSAVTLIQNTSKVLVSNTLDCPHLWSPAVNLLAQTRRIYLVWWWNGSLILGSLWVLWRWEGVPLLKAQAGDCAPALWINVLCLFPFLKTLFKDACFLFILPARLNCSDWYVLARSWSFFKIKDCQT